ncbi:MAG: hypothetical protein JSS02_33745, partial [Planctomycetes bacterium]|nr:hypothetical protein [Planctomycetota bacterium]
MPTPETPSESPRRAPREAVDGTAARRRKRVSAVESRDSELPEAEEAQARDPLVAIVTDLVRADGPSLGISVLVHVLLLTALAFVVLRADRSRVLPTNLTAFDPSGIGEPGEPGPRVPVNLGEAGAEVIEIPEARPAPAARTSTPAEEPDVQVSRPADVNVSGALAGRRAGGTEGAGGTGTGRSGSGTGGGGAGGRGALLTGQGGTDKSEQAVALGLSWLIRQQKTDGHWELHTGYPDAGQLRTNTGATALALLALLGAGHTHQDGPLKDKVARGLRWLQGIQKKSGDLKGDFYDFDREGDAASFYAHGQATIVMCEAYALTRDAELLPSIQDALAFIYESQHPKSGGWKYRRRSEGDLSVFGWQIMALQSARMAGLEVPDLVLDRASRFLDLVAEENGSRYRYEPNEVKSFTPAMTAEGLLCRQYLGWPRNHPGMILGVKYLLQAENLPDWNSGR